MRRSAMRMGRADLAMAYFEIGLGGQWDGRFGEYRAIVAMDYLRLLHQIDRGKLKTAAPDYAKARLAALGPRITAGRMDLIVMITWNTDNTDVDLHVIEPSKEECYYSHPRTKSGGRLTKDVTQGYGPEMYTLARAPAGPYRVRVKYFADDAGRMGTRTKVHVTIIERFGRPNERVTDKIVTLAYGKEMHDIATVKMGGPVIAR